MSTSKEVSIKRQMSEQRGEGDGGFGGTRENKENRASEDEENGSKKSKALRGAALMAACNFSSEEEDFDDASGAKFSEISPPGLVDDEGYNNSTKVRKRMDKARKKIDSPGRGTGRKAKKFLADEPPAKEGKALRGKALLMACAGQDEDWSSDED
jgi:hypothetical protein